MAAIIGRLIRGYIFLFDEFTDPRTKEWFLVAKPYQALTILVLYLMFIFKWGPKFMKSRQPYNLDTVMIVYNALQVICCWYIFYYGLKYAWGWKYKLFCEPVDYSNSEETLEILNLIYFYYIMKIVDLMDTVFFVLRKKFNQASFLHVYHHAGMTLLLWGVITYLPGGHGTFVGMINCFVHIIMYSYYLVSIAAPKVKKYLWLKKFVTQVQIIQFILFIVHMGAIAFMPTCAYPRWTAALFLPQNIFILILFLDFYIKTYVKRPKQKETNVKFDEKNQRDSLNNNSNNMKESIEKNQNFTNSNQNSNLKLILKD